MELYPNSKLDIISELSRSLKEDKTTPTSEITLQSLFGAYKSEDTADEIITEIKASREFNRIIETL